jgi:hypothetical protein
MASATSERRAGMTSASIQGFLDCQREFIGDGCTIGIVDGKYSA